MFAFADVVHFFADKFARLGRNRFALPLVPSSTLQSLLFRHNSFH